MSRTRVTLEVDAELRHLLRHGRRAGLCTVSVAPTDTVGHVVQSAGIPLTEVGALTLDGALASPQAQVRPGRLTVSVARRPQPTPASPPRFLLDVHLGRLTRRLRLLGLDAAYDRGAGDAALVEWALVEQRVLLSQDRGLLMRRRLPAGAVVHGSRTADQLTDVLDRFAPPLAPWTRCVRCGGRLERARPAEVAGEVEPATWRTYRSFTRCRCCRQVYWRGAHAAGLEAIVSAAAATHPLRQSAGMPG